MLARRKSFKPRKPFRTRYHSIESRRGLKDELDRVTSLIVRKRDGQCVTCGEARPDQLTCSHFYKRVWVNTRWDLRNCNCQCATCNQLHNENAWPYTSWFIDHYNTSVMAELFELRNRKTTPTNEELKYMLGQYRCMLKEMG